MDPRLIRALRAWLMAREPRLGDRVRPGIEKPGSPGPYLIYTWVSGNPVGNLQHRTGESAARVQLDVYSQDHAEASSIAANINGDGTASDSTANGLDYFAGSWPDPADAENPVAVQFAAVVRGPGDELDPPILGTETGWYCVSADYEITYERV